MSRPLRLLLALGLLLVPSAARARSCDQAGSLVPNCGFDADTQSWILIADSAQWVGSNCATGPGCVELGGSSGAIPVVAVSACFAVEPLTRYPFGVSIALASGDVGLGCFLTFNPFEDPACTIQTEAETRLDFGVAAAWTEQGAVATTGATTQAAYLWLSCASWSTSFVLRLDDALVQPPIFADGFGSGDTSRWSLSVP